MEFRRSRRMGIGADLTPLIDCVFQLLIFFLLSSSFLTPSIPLELPKLEMSRPNAKTGILVSIDRDNRLFLNKERIDRDDIGPRLTTLFAEKSTREIEFRADQKLPYGDVLIVLVALKKAGGNPIHLSYELKSNP